MWSERFPADQIRGLLDGSHNGSVVFANPPEDAADGTVVVCYIKTNDAVITGRLCFSGDLCTFRCVLPTRPPLPESLNTFARCPFYSAGRPADIVARLLDCVPNSELLIAPAALRSRDTTIAFTDDVEAYLADMSRRNLWWGTEWAGDQRQLDAYLMAYVRRMCRSDERCGVMIRNCTSERPGYLFHVVGRRTSLFVTFRGTRLLVRGETEDEPVHKCNSTKELHDCITKTHGFTLLPRVALVLEDFKCKRSLRRY